MLVHICCSVDSHYFLEKIKEDFPNEEIVGYFYDPNIHPYSEYCLRLLDVNFSCKKLKIPLIEGSYNFESWLEKIKGLESEPEKGERCTVCFDDRLEQTVKKAMELGHEKFTTTLLISPKKSQEKLEMIGEKLSEKYGLEFIFKDYRSGDGTAIQTQRVKENALYRQNYCGCLFGLTKQREIQKKLMYEMFCSISNQIMPHSIEEKLELYKKRNIFEEEKKDYKIIKQNFLNYRLLSGKISVDKIALPSYIMCYSTLSNNNKRAINGKIEYQKDGIFYLNRNEVKLLDIKTFNLLTSSNYKNVLELIYNPLSFEKELEIRQKIVKNPYDLSTLIVLDKIDETQKYEIELNSITYEDVKEKII